MAIIILFCGFAAVILVGTILVAINDTAEAFFAARTSAMRPGAHAWSHDERATSMSAWHVRYVAPQGCDRPVARRQIHGRHKSNDRRGQTRISSAS